MATKDLGQKYTVIWWCFGVVKLAMPPSEEEMQIAIEEQHGANPFYTYAKPGCVFFTFSDLSFLVYEYLTKVF